MIIKNLFAEIPDSLPEELVEILLEGHGFRLERIVCDGHATTAGVWYDQESHEWVLLLTGSAGIRFDGEKEIRVMRPGDWLHIAAHTLHRVEWTAPAEKTVWLALHYR